MDYMWVIWKPFYKINAMPTFRFGFDALFPTAEIYSFIFLKILILSSSLKWFIGMTPKKIAALYFFDKDEH